MRPLFRRDILLAGIGVISLISGATVLVSLYTPYLSVSYLTQEPVVGWVLALFSLFSFLLSYSYRTHGKLAKRAIQAEFAMRRFWYPINVEHRVLIIGGIFVGGLGITTLFVFPSMLSVGSETSGSVLQTNAQILTTIFAITISLTLLGLEYFSQDLTPRITGSLLTSNFIRFLLISYVMSIGLALFSFTFLSGSIQTELAEISFLLVAWCVIYLISYIYYMLHRIQPGTQLQMVKKQLPTDYRYTITQKVRSGQISGTDPDDIFVDVHKIAISKIEQNDYTLFQDWVALLFEKEEDYLELVEDELDEPIEYNSQEVREIEAYFFHFQSNIYQQILNTGNERFLPTYIDHVENILELLVDLRAVGPTDLLSDHFERIGQDIVEKEYETTFRTYNNALSSISKKELEEIPAAEHQTVIRGELGKYSELSEDEKNIQLWAQTARDNFSIHRLDHIEEYAIAGTEKGFDYIPQSSLTLLSELTMDILDQYEDVQVRVYYIRQILRRQRKIHEKSISAGFDIKFSGLRELQNIVEKVEDDQINAIANGLVSQFTQSAIESVKKDNFWGLQELGQNGKGLSADYPVVTEIIVDALIECLDAVEDDDELERIDEDEVAGWLKSIRDWKLEDEDLKEKITEALEDRNLSEEVESID